MRSTGNSWPKCRCKSCGGRSNLTQQPVAAALGINPVAVSKMESQTDRYVSTLRRFVEAMGGELRIVARFPQGAVEISPFQREPEPSEPAAG